MRHDFSIEDIRVLASRAWRRRPDEVRHDDCCRSVRETAKHTHTYIDTTRRTTATAKPPKHQACTQHAHVHSHEMRTGHMLESQNHWRQQSAVQIHCTSQEGKHSQVFGWGRRICLTGAEIPRRATLRGVRNHQKWGVGYPGGPSLDWTAPQAKGRRRQ